MLIKELMDMAESVKHSSTGQVILTPGKYYVVAKFDDGRVRLVGNVKGYNTSQKSEEVQDAGRAESMASLNHFFDEEGFEDFHSYKAEELESEFPEKFEVR